MGACGGWSGTDFELRGGVWTDAGDGVLLILSWWEEGGGVGKLFVNILKDFLTYFDFDDI